MLSDTESMIRPEIRLKWYRRPTQTTMQLYASVLEDYFGNGLMIHRISIKHNLPIKKVSYIINLYWRKPEFELTIPSRV